MEGSQRPRGTRFIQILIELLRKGAMGGIPRVPWESIDVVL